MRPVRGIFILTVIIVVAMWCFACSSDQEPGDTTDVDTDTDTDSDTDSDTDADTDADSDSDTDTDADTDACTATILGGNAEFAGTCQEAADECPGGVSSEDAQGTCAADTVCCIGTDQCELSGMTTCQESECAIGMQVGCPDQGWCCFGGTDTDTVEGTITEGNVCSVEYGGMLAITGICVTSGTSCEGGFIPDMEAGNCVTGLECCIGTDQCLAAGGGLMACQADDCTGTVGFPAGCPSNENCCSTFK